MNLGGELICINGFLRRTFGCNKRGEKVYLSLLLSLLLWIIYTKTRNKILRTKVGQALDTKTIGLFILNITYMVNPIALINLSVLLTLNSPDTSRIFIGLIKRSEY